MAYHDIAGIGRHPDATSRGLAEAQAEETIQRPNPAVDAAAMGLAGIVPRPRRRRTPASVVFGVGAFLYWLTKVTATGR